MYEEVVMRVISLVERCGSVLKNVDRSSFGIESKEGHGNFVTKYDKMMENMLKVGLKEIMPEAKFYGEEEVVNEDISTGYAFVVDPIDGTTNFIMDMNYSAIAVGLVKDMERIAGVVYNPYTDEMFTAIKGQGAYLNGRPIHVSNTELEDGVVIFGTSPYYEECEQESFEIARKYFKNCVDIRRLGTASLDICSVACGRAVMYFEYKLSPWDYAAASVILEEAGGIITQIGKDDLIFSTEKKGIMARNAVARVLD